MQPARAYLHNCRRAAHSIEYYVTYFIRPYVELHAYITHGQIAAGKPLDNLLRSSARLVLREFARILKDPNRSLIIYIFNVKATLINWNYSKDSYNQTSFGDQEVNIFFLHFDTFRS